MTTYELIAAYNTAIADYPVRFEGLDGDHLRRLEADGDCDSPTQHVEALLKVLDDWKTRFEALGAALASRDAEVDRIISAPSSPAGLAYRAALRSEDIYRQAREATHAAWVDWSFNDNSLLTFEEKPAEEELPPVTDCRLQGCDGFWHHDGLCEATLGEIKGSDKTGDLCVTVNVKGDAPAELAVWEDMGADIVRTTDQAVALATAARFQAFADAISKGARMLSAAGTAQIGGTR